MQLSDAESADLARILQTRPWGLVMKYLQEESAIERKKLLAGPINADRLLEYRAAQASLHRINNTVQEIYRGAKLKVPGGFDNLLG